MKTKLYTKPEVQVYEVSPTEVMQTSGEASVRMSMSADEDTDDSRCSAEYRSSLWN